MSVENVTAVQNLYAAFGKGDVPTILAAVRPDTAWSFNGALPAAPWHRPVRGVGELPAFFQAMGESIELRRFEPREFVHCGPHVMVEVQIGYVVRKTGKIVDMTQIHWWTFA